jgi:capsular exopolysaccharide synthesis family protein
MRRRLVRGYLAGREPLPGNVREAYRTLRTSLQSGGREDRYPQIVLVTSAVPGEGKTMTSVNLAIALSLAGYRVVLVDGDLRRPMVATVFGAAAPAHGLADVLLGRTTLEGALVDAPGHGKQLRLLLASPEHAFLIDALAPDRVERVFSELRLAADVAIIDSPPITEVADALALADDADAVLVAVRLGHTRRDRLNELRRMLAQRAISPTGFVVTTRRRRRRGGYYYGKDGGPGLEPLAEPMHPETPVEQSQAAAAARRDEDF